MKKQETLNIIPAKFENIKSLLMTTPVIYGSVHRTGLISASFKIEDVIFLLTINPANDEITFCDEVVHNGVKSRIAYKKFTEEIEELGFKVVDLDILSGNTSLHDLVINYKDFNAGNLTKAAKIWYDYNQSQE